MTRRLSERLLAWWTGVRPMSAREAVAALYPPRSVQGTVREWPA